MPKGNEKASPEGMGEALGSTAEAEDQKRAAREEEGRDLLIPNMGCRTSRHKRETGKAAMRSARSRALRKEKGSIH